MLRKSLIAVAGIALLGPVHAAEPEKAAAALGLLKSIDEGFVHVFEKVAPAVVVIEAIKTADDEERDASVLDFFFRNGDERGAPGEKSDAKSEPRTWKLPAPQSRSEGSGFITRADGFILTNNHVIADAEKLSVRLKDGRTFPAKVIGSDDKTDIAVIRIDARDLPAVEWGDSDALRIGQLVCAIGTPFNQDFSFTVGWVSGKGRTNLLGPGSPTILYEDYIQTDAFINPGNSGGPLFDVDGRIIGMNTLINGIGRGLAFAIPSAMLQEVAQQLIARGKVQRPWLGIRMQTLGDDNSLRDHVTGIDRGVVVYTVEADSPAYRSDLRAADVIVAVDGTKVATAHDLQKEILRRKIGQAIQLTVWRRGAIVKIPVTTGELPEEITRVANVQPPSAPSADAEALGLKLKDADGGAQVVEIVPETPAARAEILAGDVITAVETQAVATAGACAKSIESSLREKRAKSVLLNIDRKGKRTFAVLKVSQ
ncbi:MAG TPA: trypsin-like peptidase domain-containing protein [Chthoniobacteraceae bacterium]|nr:trypsin-like peptidase domain-containing protein [Chthoniobacteraceae bacterium]